MERIFALDLGCSKAAVAVAEPNDRGEAKIVAAASVPCRGVKKGVVVDLEDCQKAIEEAVSEAERQCGENAGPLVVSLGGPAVDATTVRGFQPIYPRARAITRDDVLQVVLHSRRQVIAPDREEVQAIPLSYSVDGQTGIGRPIGLNGSRLEVETMQVTADRAQVQNLQRAVEMAGRTVGALVLRPMATGLGALTSEEREHGAALIDFGSGTTDVAIFLRGAIVFADSVPLGSASITADVMKLLKTSPEEAERLKLNHGCAIAALSPPDDSVGVMQLGQIHERPMQRRVLCEIVESRAKEILQFGRQLLEKSGHLATLPGGIVLTGGGAQLSNLAELATDLMPGQKVRVAAPRIAKGSRANSPEWSTAAGLATFAIAGGEDDELATADDGEGIAGRIKTIWSLISGRA